MKNALLILGASSGIGKALAIHYAKKGWQVGLHGRRSDVLAELAASLGGEHPYFCFDINQADAAEQLQNALNSLPNCSLLVVSAGIGANNPGLAIDQEIDTLQTNVIAALQMSLVGLHHFVKQGGGHLAVLSSVASRRGDGGSPAYNASKAAVSNYLAGLRKKIYRKKWPVVVTDIRPGFVDTPMAQGPGLFWLVPVEKAAEQIYQALEHKKEVVYISKRWRLIAFIMPLLPRWLWYRM
jgi:short-subunit dehydrogenase